MIDRYDWVTDEMFDGKLRELTTRGGASGVARHLRGSLDHGAHGAPGRSVGRGWSFRTKRARSRRF
jgi:hypothetical protein